MDNSLDRFGKDSKWLKEHGFQMLAVPDEVRNQKEADYYAWTCFKKFGDFFEIRMTLDCKKEIWTACPAFNGDLRRFLNASAMSARGRTLESALKKSFKKIQEFALAIPEKWFLTTMEKELELKPKKEDKKNDEDLITRAKFHMMMTGDFRLEDDW